MATPRSEPRGLDNLVIMFDDLVDAIARYRALGFTVIPGGAHASGTEVALVAFRDGSYLQLMAFHTPSPSHRWWTAKEWGGGLIGLCVHTATLAEDVIAVRAAGVPIGDPARGGRVRPDGYRVEWSIAVSPPPFMAEFPVLIEDHTPRDERVPGERVHENGVTGIAAITIATEDVRRAQGWWSALLARPGREAARPDLDATGVRFEAGRHDIELLAPRRPSGPLAAWLEARGPSSVCGDPDGSARRADARRATGGGAPVHHIARPVTPGAPADEAHSP